MATTVTCRGEILKVLHREAGGPVRVNPRRKSVPPAQTLRAKHLLAYLPRPPPESTLHTPWKKVGFKPSMASAEQNFKKAFGLPSLNCNHEEAAVATPSQLTPPQPQAANLQLDFSEMNICMYTPPPAVQDSDTVEELEQSKPHRSHRGHHLKRFSSRWHPSSFSTNQTLTQFPGNLSQEKFQKKQCKLLGDEQRAHFTTGKQRQRYITKEGKCRVNLGPIEDKSRFLSDIFTTLVDLKYRWFLFVFTMCYIVTWVAFAEIYLLDAWLRDDVNHVNDPQWKCCFENVDGFLSALLLSVESQRTIGYGSRMVTANCVEGVVLIMVQSILGSIIDALMVGCMFVKISRPQKRAQTLIFSKYCVISERDGKLCLLFRIGDLRESHMVDAKIRAKLIKSRQTAEGEFIPLEQSEINLGYDTGGDRLLLVEPQTITHVINENSPFWEIGAESLKREKFEIIVILEGIVEASGMTCQARTSYAEDEILWGRRFESCMSLEEGAFRVDYSTFDKTFEVQTSPQSAKERSEEKDGEVLF
ncbi:G protein-activated inward rectifier potassium channel 3-like [Chanos chanos]|uniref:G protein-activated inward rectifier potassium channel 3 n=1 Tax=Chanos chanos TaxID=29144 RepID=A0A6J2W640_CHACN|nr:G protein-activated inward rectifier potassium channel 3-like [Chanos chanos]